MAGSGGVAAAQGWAVDEALATLQARVIRATSGALAVLTAVLVATATAQGLDPGPGPLLGATAVVYHAAGAVLPWPSWLRSPHGPRWVGLHLAVSLALIGTGLVVAAPAIAAELLWLFTLTTAQAAATRTPRGQAITFAVTAGIGGTATLLAPGIGATNLVVSLVALAALAVLSHTVCRGYLQAVGGEAEARRTADQAVDRALALAEASRALVDGDPEAVLEAIVATTERLGYPYSGVYAHDPAAGEVHYVAARGLAPELRGARFPDDSGVAGLVLARGTTVVVDDYATHPRANPAFVGLLSCAIGTPIRSADDTVRGVLVCGRHDAATVTDLDQRIFELLAAHAGRALQLAEGLRHERERVAELAELDRLKSDFVATVSHELRTPLTVVCGLSETIATHWDELDLSLVRNLLGRIHANATALDDVIATLLDFGNLERGQLRPQVATFDLSDAVSRTTSRLEPVFADHHLQVTVVPGIQVEGDPRLLDRVVENLLTNAARHTPPGTAVDVSVREDADVVLVEVTDAGDGMPEHERVRIGERFFRGGVHHDTRHTRGMGLGLALASEVLQLHGSDLEVRSTVGHGTTFAFRMPLVRRPVRSVR